MCHLFKTDLLQSFPAIAHFLDGREPLLRIERRVASSHLSQKCELTELAAAPFKMIISMFLWRIAPVLDKFGHPALSLKFQVYAETYSQEASKSSIYIFKYKDRLLVPCVNGHNPETTDVYLQPPLPMYEVRDFEVLDTVYFHEQRQINFYHKDGLEAGIRDWFLALYLKSRKLSPNQEDILIAAAKEFEYGAPREAALLQSLKVTRPTYLKIDGNLEARIDQIEQIPSILKHLTAGVYAIDHLKHAMALIKIDDNHLYFFHAKVGLVRMTSSEVTNYISTYLENLDIYSALYFERMNLAENI